MTGSTVAVYYMMDVRVTRLGVDWTGGNKNWACAYCWARICGFVYHQQ